MNFEQKEEFILSNFEMKNTSILWISGSKRSSFSTQEISRKIFPFFRNLHDILRTKTDELSVLKKTI